MKLSVILAIIHIAVIVKGFKCVDYRDFSIFMLIDQRIFPVSPLLDGREDEAIFFIGLVLILRVVITLE